MSWPASEIAAEIRRRLPGVGVVKLHKLLYYCQGHHLAYSGQPLFRERLSAWDHGPVVGHLWWEERNGRRPTRASAVDGRPGDEVAPAALDESARNTIGYVVSRYGPMTAHDLEVLTHHETPWLVADAGRQPEDSAPIDPAVMTAYFRGDGAGFTDSDGLPTDTDTIRDFLSQAAARGPGPGRPDTPESLLRAAGLG